MIKLQLPKNIQYYFTHQIFSTEVLYPEELIYSNKYETKRLNEFCTGRYCAHQSLKYLQKNGPVKKLPTGAPLWPQHIIGSISHSQKLTGAITTTTKNYKSIGLDIETIGRIDPELWELLFTPNEITFLKQQPNNKHHFLSTLFFSLKEAFYKMQFPITQTFIDFQDCEIIKIDEKYRLKFLKEEYLKLNNLFKYEMNFTIYNDQIITYIIAFF